MRIYAIFILAGIGLLLTGYIIYTGNAAYQYKKNIPEPPPAAYKDVIACQGIVESRYKNIAIGCPFSDVITQVYVTVGQQVEQGDPLFVTDTRKLLAQYDEARKDLECAQEDYALQDTIFHYYENLTDKSAVSQQAYVQAEYAKILALKRYEKAQAVVATIATDIERSVVRAPFNGQVLQLNIRPGQYAQQTTIDSTPLILFGNTDCFHVRIDIDEEDAWRFKSGCPGYACIRGNTRIKIPLEYLYLEPYIIPKKSLTGYDQERTDTRVLQVVYCFNQEEFPVYAGQLLDVYLEATPHEVLP